MTKLELIEALEFIDNDAEIFVAVQTHDYWGHVKFVSIHDVDQKRVHYSNYLESLTESTNDQLSMEIYVIELDGS